MMETEIEVAGILPSEPISACVYKEKRAIATTHEPLVNTDTLDAIHIVQSDQQYQEVFRNVARHYERFVGGETKKDEKLKLQRMKRKQFQMV